MAELENQREFSRVQIPVRVEIARPGKMLFSGLAQDVSLNGLRVKSAEAFDADVPCDVSILLGEDSTPVRIDASGCVVRSDGTYVAVCFDAVELEGYEHLKKLIQYNAADLDQVEREFNEHVGLRRSED